MATVYARSLHAMRSAKLLPIDHGSILSFQSFYIFFTHYLNDRPPLNSYHRNRIACQPFTQIYPDTIDKIQDVSTTTIVA